MVPRRELFEEHKVNLVLDALDRKILYYWDFNARASAADIAKKVKARQETVAFRMKRLLQNKIILSTSVETLASKLGYSAFKIYFQFQHYTTEVEKEFYDYLKKLPSLAWIVSCSGRWDAIIGYYAKSMYEFNDVFSGIVNKFSDHILHKEVIFNVDWFYYNRKWLVPGLPLKAIRYGHKTDLIKIDDIDKNILHRLANNGRTLIVDLAKAAGESSQNIINRKRRLEKSGLITKYSLNLNYKKLGMVFCKAFIYLQNKDPERIAKMHSYCSAQPNIFAWTTTLGVWDLELEFEAESFDQMRSIMDEIKLRFNDIVKNYEAAIITDQMTPRYAWD